MNKVLVGLCVLLALSSTIEAKQSRAIQNFYCNDNVNNQIKMEFDASNIYLSLSNYFGGDLVALPGLSKMFEKSWKEEVAHGEKFINYVIKRGGSVITPEVAKPVNDGKWENMNACEVIEYVLNLEKKVHASLLKLHQCASGDSGAKPEDPHMQDFIEAEYLGEQVDANKELADLLTKLERTTKGTDGKSMCDGLGLHIIDKEILAKY